MQLIALSEIRPDMLPLVGGKAIGLARLIAEGERVPEGFCLTTDAHRAGEVPRDALVERWREQLDGAPVAVRSSATAEDLPDASFAGLQETVLSVMTAEELVEAVERCWASLESERAVAYRERRMPGEGAAMAVVVQRMVDASAAGVLFTANPVTGTRTQQVVDAAVGLGDAVVDGTVTADHAELDDGRRPAGIPSLTAAQLAELQRTGRRIEAAAGSPQDVEFAFDPEGQLWLLQSRAITTLFPQPQPDDGGLHAYLEVGHMQGMLQPATPMGESMLLLATRDVTKAFGLPMQDLLAFIGGRMFIDLTPIVRNRLLRRALPGFLRVYGASLQATAPTLLAHPGLQPRRQVRARQVLAAAGRLLGVTARFAWPVVAGSVQAIRDPAAARRRAHAVSHAEPERSGSAAQRLAAAQRHQRVLMTGGMVEMMPALYGAIAARALARGLLAGVAEPGDIERTQRGMPHNPTTEMDLELWQLSRRALAHRSLFAEHDARELADLHASGALPEFGLDTFLERYGHRCAAEIDVGVPRWAEDPAPVLSAIAGYLAVDDEAAAPDARFLQAADEASATIDDLESRAVAAGHPVRGRIAASLLRTTRELAGLRELPKFVWVQALRDVRDDLRVVGAELARRGAIAAPDDVFMLDLQEANDAMRGRDLRSVVADRRSEHERESRRAHVPALLLSDGTFVQPATELGAGGVQGTPAAAGTATGRARVVRDPGSARIEPGEILIAPTTDPGWTPLFMTAGGLVTETGSPMAHGPTVAREYGIPAVIGVPDATTRFETGDLLTIDGSTGTIVAETAAG